MKLTARLSHAATDNLTRDQFLRLAEVLRVAGAVVTFTPRDGEAFKIVPQKGKQKPWPTPSQSASTTAQAAPECIDEAGSIALAAFVDPGVTSLTMAAKAKCEHQSDARPQRGVAAPHPAALAGQGELPGLEAPQPTGYEQ